MKHQAQLVGISVGPGDPELITVKGLEALRTCDILFAPQAAVSTESIAKGIVDYFEIPEERFRLVTFEMDRDRSALHERYAMMAEQIVAEVNSGSMVGFLTLGDALTFSTWIYTLEAVKKVSPETPVTTIPGVTSFAALAATTNAPLGEQKESVLILPCPDHMEELRSALISHDTVVLMKIGHRFHEVIHLLKEMDLLENCILGKKVGMEDGEIYESLAELPEVEKLGYFSTILVSCLRS